MGGQLNMSVEFREEEGAGNGNVGVVGLLVIIKPGRLGEIS